MPYSSRVKPSISLKDKVVLTDVASYEETQALLKLLARGDQEVAAGKLKPATEVIARLRAKRAAE